MRPRETIGTLVEAHLFLTRDRRQPVGIAWQHAQAFVAKDFTCGYCSREVASEKGYASTGGPYPHLVAICPRCNRPTYLSPTGDQVPGPIIGNVVSKLPKDVESLYDEARRSAAHSSFTGAVLLCRKLLMHLAVEKGAKPGESFKSYVDYLAANRWLPPNSEAWVDHVRSKGNEANHEIVHMSKDDATELLSFLEMLLKFMYEFPARVAPKATTP
jgi:hypothetical protein